MAELTSQTEIIVALKEDGKEPEDDKRRFKVVLNMVNKVDLDTIVGFSKGEAQSAQVREETVSYSWSFPAWDEADEIVHCCTSLQYPFPTGSE